MKNPTSVNKSWRALARPLARDESGATMVEFTLVSVLLFSLTFAIVEFALYSYQMNAAEKAAEAGVRLAVESNPVAGALATYNAVTDGGFLPGENLTLGSLAGFTVSCGNVTCTCGAGACASIGGGGFGFDAAAFNAILARVQAIFPRVQPANMVVEYRHVGLGFAGRPGPDIVPVVMVRFSNLTYNVVAMDAFGLGVTLPLTAASSVMTGEDLSSLAPG